MMHYVIKQDGGALVVGLSGQLEFSCNEVFEDMLGEVKAAHPSKVVLDMTEVTALDSVGLGLLFIAKEEFDEINCRFVLRNAGGPVARLLNLSNAHMTFIVE